jgi:gamma-glutamylcyclotransferase (GGCT)/AIG2-like uncharacterized protein YtfP
MELFVYGTLTESDVLLRVAGRTFPAEPAVLEGYRRIEEPGCYAFVEPCAGEHVDGMLLRDVDADAISRFDDYEDEGQMYFRRAVQVRVGDRLLACETYVGNRDAVLAARRD